MAADADSIELWNIMSGPGRWQVPGLAGGWLVALSPEARGQRVLRELPTFLKHLEEIGVNHVDATRWDPGPLELAASALGVMSLRQGDTTLAGSIYPTIKQPAERSSGFVDETGNSLVEWINEWLLEPRQQDNLEKLHDSGCDERHLFVILPGLTVAPFTAADVLMRTGASPPSNPPNLPAELTHLWLASTWDAGHGMRWFPDSGWDRFGKKPQARF